MKFNLEYMPDFSMPVGGPPQMEAIPILDIQCDCGRKIRYALRNGCHYDRLECEALEKMVGQADQFWKDKIGFAPFAEWKAIMLDKIILDANIALLEITANTPIIKESE